MLLGKKRQHGRALAFHEIHWNWFAGSLLFLGSLRKQEKYVYLMALKEVALLRRGNLISALYFQMQLTGSIELKCVSPSDDLHNGNHVRKQW